MNLHFRPLKPALPKLLAVCAMALTPAWMLAQSTDSNNAKPADPASPNPQTQPAPQNPQGPQPAQGTTQKKTKGTSKDRLFYALPNFLTLENAQHVPPLTTGQKFAVVAKGSFDPIQYFWVGAIAGLSQAENSEPRYGQGAEGYAKRFGVHFADTTVENFMAQAIFPSLLHQDPRYYQSGKGGVWHRVGYAVARVFVTRSDSGNPQFNYSEIFGAAAAATISTYTYHLKNEHNLGNAATIYGSQILYDSLGYIVKEFWPDLRRKMHKTKDNQVQPSQN
jgi:hypothetical protein